MMRKRILIAIGAIFACMVLILYLVSRVILLGTFAELEEHAPEERVFDVAIQGRTVLEGFDIAAETGGALRGIVKEFTSINGDSTIEVSFRAVRGEAILSGLQIIPE